ITRALTLRGDATNPGAFVIDGGGAGDTVRILSCGTNVVFEGVTITGGARGNDGYGGGVFMADSSVIFHDCVFTGNAADLDGGGAFILRSGGLFEGCSFHGNRAGRFGGGAMVNVGGTTVFEHCLFVGNEAGVTDGVNGWGGGVHDYRARYEITDSVIEDNRADVVEGQGGTGGGLYAQSVTVGSPGRAAEVVVRDTVIRRNVADVGGGIYIQGDFSGLTANQARLDVSDSLI